MNTRTKSSWLVSTLLVGVLTLSGCAAGATAATPTNTSSSISTAALADTTSAVATTTAGTITDTTAAAEAFLVMLSSEQRETVLHAYDDETKSTSWSNFPVTFVERAGLNLTDLTEEQQTAALAVLRGLLSEEGYATVVGIIGGDQYLVANGSAQDSLGQYYIAFFGDPSETGAWGVQFGGHHLGGNATLDGAADTITFAPTHLGVQPAVFTDDSGEEVAPLSGMYETAFAFYDSLSTEQQAALYQGEEVQTMQCEPGSTCTYPTGTGLSGADLTDEQKQLLLEVIANWVGLSDEQTTATALAGIEATLDETYVNWSGATVYDMTTGEGIHFQISGPDVYIEFANQELSADVNGAVTSGRGHVHTIYRDPADDYAGSATQQEATGGVGGQRGGAGAPPADGGAAAVPGS